MGYLHPYALIGLMAYHAETQWPPTYPRRGTLLTPHDDPTTPRESWGADEWKAYALFLEEAGSLMAKQSQRERDELRRTRKKLSRRRGEAQTIRLGGTLLTSEPSQPKKRGRKPADHTRRIAEGVLAIRSSNPRLTDRQALGEYYHQQGLRRSRANEGPARNILNTVSKLRKIRQA